jgi:Ca2+-binding RTX toxin-like protein
MTTLNSTQISTLTSDLASHDVASFYDHLYSYGDDYGRLGATITRDDSWVAELTTGFAQSAAARNDIDLSYGSTAWTTLNEDLANGYLQYISDDSGDTPGWQNIQAIHNDAYTNAGIDVNGWLPNTLLNDSDDPGTLWQGYVANTDPLSLWGSALDVMNASGDLLFGPSLAKQAWSNPDSIDPAQVAFSHDFLEGLVHMDKAKLEDMLGDFTGNGAVTGFLDDLMDMPQNAHTLLDNFGLALDHPSDLLSSILPGFFGDNRDHFHDGKSEASPLVIDLSSGHTGITLTEFDASTTTTFFDIEGTGFATQTAWTSGDTGFLVRDLNSNGLIDNVNEMFGSPTVDGFAKLAALDSNHDLKIDSLDSAWSSLQVWVDANGDGITQSGELHSLSSLNISSIDLAGVAPSTSTIDGNPISHTSTVTFSSGATAAIGDAWFVHDSANSHYTGDFTLDPATLFLPDLRGYGTMPDLTTSMSQDSTLKGMVEDFETDFGLASFADPSTLDSDVKDILYQWAGVEGVDTTSRGPHVDAQHLDFLESLFDEAFTQNGGRTTPDDDGGRDVETSWNGIFANFKADLLIQVGADSLFDAPVTYNPWTGTIDGTVHLSESAISTLAADAPGTDLAAQAFWVGLAGFINTTEGISSLDSSEHSWLDSAVTSTTTVGWDDIVNIFNDTIPGATDSGTNGNDSITAGAGDDTITGLAGNDVIHAGAGNDVVYDGDGANLIYGDAGNDTITSGGGNNEIHGGDGNDVIWVGNGTNAIYGDAGSDEIHTGTGTNEIHGGTGGNLLYGGSGATNYIFGGGDDLITDGGGTDQITLPSGITSSDLTFNRVETGGTGYFNDLLITVDDGVGGSIQIVNHFASSSDQVETLVFSDSSTIDLAGLTTTNYTIVLSSGDDYYSPGLHTDQVVQGGDGADDIVTGSGNDTLDGGNGNDLLQGGSGNDTYIASPGFDKISDTGGTDIIQILTGYSIDDVTFSRHIGTYGPDNDLIIDIRDLGEIQVENQFYSSSYSVESLYFVDGSSTVSLADQTIKTIGTSGNDTLYGITSSVAGNWFDGRGGNDYISNGIGDNTYVFSAGFGTDTVSSTYHSGTNSLEFTGIDPSHIRMWTDVYGGLHLQDTTDTSHSITISAATTGSGTGESAISSYLEQISFDDSGHTTWDLTGGLTLTGTNSGVSLYGTAYGDTITGGTGADNLYGNGGNDTLVSGGGADYLYGGTGNDTYVFASGFGGSNITDNSASGSNVIHFSGIDPSDIRMWTDTYGALHLQDTTNPSDSIIVSAGTTGSGTSESTIGSYFSEVTFDGSYATTWDLTGGLTITGTSGYETLYGTAYGDVISGMGGGDQIYGNGGNDTLISASGSADYLNGGAGNDTFVFFSGFGSGYVTDNANGSASNQLHFGGIDPTDIRMWTDYSGALHLQDTTDASHNITVYAGTTGSGTYESTVGTYFSQVTFDSSYSTTWDLTGGLHLTADNSGDSLYGTAYGDTIAGGTGADNIYGNGGADTIISGGGADYLTGGSGNDTYVFASGFGTSSVNDNSSTGANVINFTGIDPADIRMWTDYSGALHLQDTTDASHNITVYAGTTGSGTYESTIGTYFSQVTFDSGYSTTWDLTGGLTITGTSSSESLYGTAHDDTLNGLGGGDTLMGNAGNDSVNGGSSADYLYGGDGNDILYGGGGNDYLTGNAGADTFLFKGATAESGVSIISDFNTSDGDKIDLADVVSGYDPLTMAIANFVQLGTSGANTTVSVDTDGSGTSYTQIVTLASVTGLNLNDLITDGNLIVHHT